MSVIQIVGGILLILASVIITVAVTVQEPKSEGLGSALGGGGGSFLDRNRSRTKDAKMALLTKYAGGLLFAVSIVMMVSGFFA